MGSSRKGRAVKRKSRSALRAPATAPPRTLRQGWHEEMRTRFGAVGTFIGQQNKDGRYTGKTSLVCIVERKRPLTRLDRQHRIPRTVRWTEGRRNRRLITDVVAARPRMKLLANEVGPGVDVFTSAERATVGVAIDHPQFGECVTTAGHAFPDEDVQGQQVTLQTDSQQLSGRAVLCRQRLGIDYALIQPDAGVTADNLYQGQFRAGPAFIPSAQDIGKSLLVLVPGSSGQPVPVICRGVDATFDVPGRGRYEHVILTDPSVRAGQSGACLVDQQARVWGLLIGLFSDTFAVFMPVSTVLLAEGAVLI